MSDSFDKYTESITALNTRLEALLIALSVDKTINLNDALNNVQKFDTGGYTGDWSGEGRFAMLHQKEIVLNKDDTENFLKTVDIVRQISDMIDLNAMSASGGLGSLFAASVNKDNGVLEQNVHITAEFPNATNKDEILSAFDNVVNLASQYANRKR